MPEFRPEIEKERKTGIGGSDISAMLGFSRRRSRYDLYLEKILPSQAGILPPPQGREAHYYWGLSQEKMIAEAYIRLTNRRVRRRNAVIRHSDTPHFIGHLDFLVHPQDGSLPVLPNGEIRTDLALECASAFLPNSAWGISGSAKVPVPYALKVQWYMGLIPSLKAFDLAVLFGGKDFRVYRIQRDDSLIRYLQQEADFFWREHVQKRIPPPPLTEREVRQQFPDAGEKPVEASQFMRNLLRNYLQTEQTRIQTESIRKELRDRILVYMGGSDVLRNSAGIPLATFRKTSNGHRIFKITKAGNSFLNQKEKGE